MGNFLLGRLALPIKTTIEQLPLVVPPSITIVASTFNRRFTVEKKPQRTISLTPISRRNYGREKPSHIYVVGDFSKILKNFLKKVFKE